jgi:hypothetical protein
LNPRTTRLPERLRGNPVIAKMAAGTVTVPLVELAHQDGTPRTHLMNQANRAFDAAEARNAGPGEGTACLARCGRSVTLPTPESNASPIGHGKAGTLPRLKLSGRNPSRATPFAVATAGKGTAVARCLVPPQTSASRPSSNVFVPSGSGHHLQWRSGWLVGGDGRVDWRSAARIPTSAGWWRCYRRAAAWLERQMERGGEGS